MSSIFAYSVNAFAIAVLAIFGLREFAIRVGMVDRPNARKKHQGIIPVYGGIAVSLGFASSALGFSAPLRVPWYCAIAFGLLLVLGAVDDRFGLRAGPRLVVQTLAGLLLVTFGASVPLNVNAIIPTENLPILVSATICVGFIVGMTNAINMMDGIDGLAGLTAVGGLIWTAVLGAWVGQPAVAVHAVVLACAAVGFLLFNMRHPWHARGSVFLGDAGAMTLGAALAYFMVQLSTDTNGPSFLVLLWLVIVPVTDTLSLIVRRLIAGQSPLAADRRHLHHLLLDRGLTEAQASSLIAGTSAFCGAIGTLAIIMGINPGIMIAGLSVPVLLHTAFVFVAPVQDVDKPGRRSGSGLQSVPVTDHREKQG
jgi:UDP-GlcNAc:undecaprenyl-phosphate GlcNAc-1-phosphate transferase